jgi:hypothetical protein
LSYTRASSRSRATSSAASHASEKPLPPRALRSWSAPNEWRPIAAAAFFADPVIASAAMKAR